MMELYHNQHSVPRYPEEETGAKRRRAGLDRCGMRAVRCAGARARWSGCSHPERDLMRRELGTRITSALDRLTPRERMVFELKHYHGLKLRTVGEILHTTEETAKNTLFRATQKLRGALADMR